MRYLLNSAVITAPGRYEYRHLTAEGAAEWYRGAADGTYLAAEQAVIEARLGSSYPAYEAAVARREAAWAAASAPPVSTIGYPETAAALGELLGAAIAVDRRTITMAPGDEALVFRLALPPGSPRIDPADKGRLGREILAGHYELGLLARVMREGDGR